MNYNNISVNVLIKGRPITEYAHNGMVFVEGRANSEFELEVFNRNPYRVEVILSVDGLSVTDGKDAGPNSPGYLIEANGSIRIPGWKLNDGQAAAFEFTGKGGSYAEVTTGSSRNTGVIGLMAFAEKHRRVNDWAYNTMRSIPSNSGSGWYGSSAGGLESVGAAMPMSKGIAPGSSRARGIAMNAVDASYTAAAYSADSMSLGICSGDTAATASASVQNLGTGFGAATEFNTTSVSFERGDLVSTIVLYYDDRRGLSQRGIVFDKKSSKRQSQRPNAFPGMSGCVPPAGWNG